MSLNTFNEKLKNVLFLNTIHRNYKDISRNNNYNQTLNKSIISTNKKIKRDNITIPLRRISTYHTLNSPKLNSIKTKNDYNYNTYIFQKNIKNIEIFDDINNFKNLNNNNKNNYSNTIEYLNDNKKRKIFKRYNSFNFKNINKGKKLRVNIPQLTLKNELYKLDKDFLREISPINNFIYINKMVNEYKKENKRKIIDKKDNFYFLVNSSKDKNKKTNFKYFDYNKKFAYQNKNHNKLFQKRMPSFSNLKTYQI